MSQIKYKISSKNLLIWGIIAFVVLVLLAIYLPWLVTHLTFGELGVTKSNEIGETIGGIMGPASALIGAALAFLAFWAQYDANLEQRRQFEETLAKQKIVDNELKQRYESERKEQIEKYQQAQLQQQTEFSQQQKQFAESQSLQQKQIALQDTRTRLDLFESRYHTMLSIHRDNVNGMDINNEIKGRKVFLLLIDELRFLYFVIKTFYDKDHIEASPAGPISDDEIYQVVYLSFFFGIGEKSTPLVKDLVCDKLISFVENSHQYVSNLASQYDAKEIKLYAIDTIDSVKEWKSQYQLGVGHLRRLSHYVRHLFQTVKFVDEQPSDLLTDEQKYDYITNLRAQLSTHEQLLLYYNALSVLGAPWLQHNGKESYFEKYCMVKSMPLNSADFYRRPEEVLPKTNLLNKSMFEWIEIRKRMQNYA